MFNNNNNRPSFLNQLGMLFMDMFAFQQMNNIHRQQQDEEREKEEQRRKDQEYFDFLNRDDDN